MVDVTYTVVLDSVSGMLETGVQPVEAATVYVWQTSEVTVATAGLVTHFGQS